MDLQIRSRVGEYQFSSRLARSSDRDNIARLCRRAVGRNDYVLHILDEILGKRRLFVVFSRNGELIGMSSFTPVFDRSGWLGMARTDPDWRGKGVAQFLQRTIASHAKEKGIRKLRFFVLSTNTSSLRAATKGGFKWVAHASHVTFSLKSSRSLRNISGIKLEPGRISMHQMLNSRYVSKMNGYLRYGYVFVRARRDTLQYTVRKKELFCYGNSSFILKKTDEKHAEFSILTGSVRDTLLKILKIALEMKAESVSGFVPFDHYVIRLCRSLGFVQDSWGKHSIVFEKSI